MNSRYLVHHFVSIEHRSTLNYESVVVIKRISSQLTVRSTKPLLMVISSQILRSAHPINLSTAPNHLAAVSLRYREGCLGRKNTRVRSLTVRALVYYLALGLS